MPSNSQTWWPWRFSTILGAWSAKRVGQPSLEHVRRLDQMVVDRDDRVADRSRLGIREQGVPSGDDGQTALPHFADRVRPHRAATARGHPSLAFTIRSTRFGGITS